MRILLTADPQLPVPPILYGGIERIVDAVARELRLHGHEVGLVALAGSSCPVDSFFPWAEECPHSIVGHARNLKVLFRAAFVFKPDVIHSFSRLAYLLPLMPRNIPKVMSYQRYTGGKQIRIASILAGDSLIFTACSQFVARMGRPSGGDWRVIHNFTDTEYFDLAAETKPYAPLLFLSRVERIKGAHLAIQIAMAAGRRLLIAGNRVDSEEGRRYWDTEIARHLSNSAIEYVGEVNDSRKRQLLREAAALLVPIEWDEPFGIVFVEALACGTPVISRARGAVGEIVADGVEGFLIATVDDGCRAVERISEISRLACRRKAETCFSAPVVTNQYLSLYDEVIARVKR